MVLRDGDQILWLVYVLAKPLLVSLVCWYTLYSS